MKHLFILFTLYLGVSQSVCAQNYPSILVKDENKSLVLTKIKEQPWAKTIFEKTKEEVDFYVNQHINNPSWILDRYLMNRVPGKRYTHFISDQDGTQLIAYEGDAPVPTVRVSPHKRAPVTPDGTFYVAPEIKDLIPNDTSLTMTLRNPTTNQYERIDPQSYVNKINTSINRLALQSAVIYWLTDEDKYARFSADILDQWGKGAVYQQPISGPGRVGFLDIQTLGDEGSKSLILAYDFVRRYMQKQKYNLDYYDIVFEKIAATLAFNGYTENNWYAAESSTMVAAALSLSDKEKQDYYLSFYLSRDTVNNGHGQLAMPSTIKKWFTPDGHWKEPGGYHNYPVSKLIESAMMLENNDIEVFRLYPQLLDASYVMLKYSFPDLTASAFGDTGRPVQSAYCLEIAIRKAQEYKLPILNNLLAAMSQLQGRGMYNRSQGGLEGLLSYLPELPELDSQYSITWDRTGKLDFASFYLQRNGMDRKTGLMCTVQGATYNHNHSNGMAMEIYGKGTVMGIDPGNGPTYEHPMHVNYYTQWAAHNTVIAAGSSTSTYPFMGGGGTKQIGEVKLISMEPLAGEKGISENYSFTLTAYHDKSTNTQQQRLLALIRLNQNEGYYLDIYSSDNPVSNDYLYHNIGDNVSFFNTDGTPVKTNSIDTYPITKEDAPGLRYFKQVETTGKRDEGLSALFSASDLPTGKSFMKMWIPGSKDRIYYKAMAPVSKTAIAPYNKRRTPVIGIRTEGPASESPFVVLFEPTDKGLHSTISSVKQYVDKSNNTGVILEVETVSDQKQIIFTSFSPKEINKDGYVFSGDYGIITTCPENSMYYLGNGTKLTNVDFSIETKDKIKSNVFILKQTDRLEINASNPCRVIIKDKTITKKIEKENAGLLFNEQSGFYILHIDSGKYSFKINN